MTGAGLQFPVSEILNGFLASANLTPLTPDQISQFDRYLSLILHWNAKTNLTAIREPRSILERNFGESIACAQFLPAGISTLLDFGSGAGLPGIPIALCRPEISVTLAESQGKKAAFLREVVRVLKLEVRLHSGRAESVNEQFDAVTLRAVDQMEKAVRAAAGLVRAGGWLALMTTSSDVPILNAAAGGQFSWPLTIALPGAKDKILALGRKAGAS
jgi:16S rRNA (guanine527-N7)-methyltransferase